MARTPSRWTAALLLSGLIASPVLAEAVKSYQVPAVIKTLTSKYGSTVVPQGPSTSALQQPDPLGHLLALQRQHWSGAWVTSTFYDYRSVSRYRRQPGLHLGYDIALPFGCAVSAGWDGVVTDIIPWTDTEYGVTVTDASGLAVTYGHVTPLVSIGQPVRAGAVIARVASDHVDVKMRDAAGQYLAFGEGSKANSAVLASAPVVDRKALLTGWLVAKTTADQAAEELFLKEHAAQKVQLEKRSAERKVSLLQATLAELSRTENSALVSRKRLEELRAELRQAQNTLQTVQSRSQTSAQQLRRQAEASRAQLQAFEAWAKSEGLTWKDVENLVARTVASDSSLNQRVVQAKQQGAAVASLTLAQLQQRRDEGRRQLAKLEELYAMGGMSFQEIADQRLRQELLEEEYALRKKSARVATP